MINPGISFRKLQNFLHFNSDTKKSFTGSTRHNKTNLHDIIPICTEKKRVKENMPTHKMNSNKGPSCISTT